MLLRWIPITEAPCFTVFQPVRASPSPWVQEEEDEEAATALLCGVARRTIRMFTTELEALVSLHCASLLEEKYGLSRQLRAAAWVRRPRPFQAWCLKVHRMDGCSPSPPRTENKFGNSIRRRNS